MTGSCAAGPAAGWWPSPLRWRCPPAATGAGDGGAGRWVVRVPEQGFELPVPAGWKLQRQLAGPGSQVVGVVLVPRSGEPPGVAVTVAADPDQPLRYTLELQVDASEGGVPDSV
jgi:hypothetical protein